jgi:hypothetical protein
MALTTYTLYVQVFSRTEGHIWQLFLKLKKMRRPAKWAQLLEIIKEGLNKTVNTRTVRK